MRNFLFAALLLCALARASAEAPATFDVGSFTFTRPAQWDWVPVNSPMRKAQLKVPGATGEAAEITFFYFGEGQGGNVDANVQRWLRQFESVQGAEKTTTQQAGATKITLVSTQGTYHSGMPGGPTTSLEHQALLGAILEGPQGNVFVKMTGPVALVEATREKFIQFITAAANAPKK